MVSESEDLEGSGSEVALVLPNRSHEEATQSENESVCNGHRSVGHYRCLDSEESKPLVFPYWFRICVVATAVAAVSCTVTLVVLIAEAKPAIAHVAQSAQDVFDGIDVEELNTAMRRAVKVLDIICKDMLHCD